MNTSRFMFAEEGYRERDVDKGLSLAQRVHPKYRPVFDKLPDRDRAALALYFLPHGSKKDILEVTRPHVLKWYCPFADQRQFPSGHRYSINVYTGCEHRCEYCYAGGYVAGQPHCKDGFRRDFEKDLDDLDEYDVPAGARPSVEQHRRAPIVGIGAPSYVVRAGETRRTAASIQHRHAVDEESGRACRMHDTSVFYIG